MDRQKGEIRFDKWYAYIDKSEMEHYDELLDLRKTVMPTFKDCIEGRDLNLFPRALCERILHFVKRDPPMKLRDIEAVSNNIAEELTGEHRQHVSIFEWPVDTGFDEEEEEEGGE